MSETLPQQLFKGSGLRWLSGALRLFCSAFWLSSGPVFPCSNVRSTTPKEAPLILLRGCPTPRAPPDRSDSAHWLVKETRCRRNRL